MSWIRTGRSKAGLRDGALCRIVLLGQKVGPFDDDDAIIIKLALTAPSTLPPHRNANEVRARRPDHGDVDRFCSFSAKLGKKGGSGG